MVNSNGQRKLPRGTPSMQLTDEDYSAPRATYCFRSEKKRPQTVATHASAPFITLDLLHGMHSQRTYVPTMIAQFLGNNSKLTFYLSF